jgi:hypothetical protein
MKDVLCTKHLEKINPETGICPCCRNERTLQTVVDYNGFDTIDGDNLETGIYDLLADLLHLAKDNGIDPDEMIRMGKMHFEAEIDDEH